MKTISLRAPTHWKVIRVSWRISRTFRSFCCCIFELLSVAFNNKCSSSPLLSQRKGILQGAMGPWQSPVATEMGVSLTTMDKNLMTSRQWTLAPHCYYNKQKCFYKLTGARHVSLLLRTVVLFGLQQIWECSKFVVDRWVHPQFSSIYNEWPPPEGEFRQVCSKSPQTVYTPGQFQPVSL